MISSGRLGLNWYVCDKTGPDMVNELLYKATKMCSIGNVRECLNNWDLLDIAASENMSTNYMYTISKYYECKSDIKYDIYAGS